MTRTRSLTPLVYVIAFSVAMLMSGPIGAEQYFERPQFEHQLPQRSALAVLVDRADRLWLGTREGIARWDGSRMRYWRHRPFEPNSLGGNVARGLVEDRRGDIWAFNHTGFYGHTEPSRLLAPTHEQVRRYPFPGAFVLSDTDGEVLLVHEGGLYRFDAAIDAFDLMCRWSTATTGVAEVLAEPGVVWIATVDGQLRRCEMESRMCTMIDTDEVALSARITSLWRDRHGQLNAGLASAGVVRIDEQSQALVALADWPAEWSSATVRDSFQWRQRVVLLSTMGLIWNQDDSASECPNRRGSWCRRPVPRGDGPDDATISSAAIDAHGVLWVGSNWGLTLHDPRAAAFRHWWSGRDGDLEDGWVMALAEGTDGAIWAGTFNGRLYQIDPRDGQVRTRLRLTQNGDGVEFRVIWAIYAERHADGDQLWLGTSSGLVEFWPDSGEYRLLNLPGTGAAIEGDGEVSGDPGFLNTLAPAEDGGLWLGTNGGGLWHFDPSNERFVRSDNQAPQWINHVLSEQDALWVASTNDGVYRIAFDGSKPMRFDHRPDDPVSLSSDTVWMQVRDRRGALWLGTDTGLALLDGRRNSFSYPLTGHELPSIAAMSVVEDRFDRIWIGTNSGLVRLDPQTGTVRRFDLGDGLLSIEYNRRAALAAHDGTLYFGGNRGIVAVNPEVIQSDTTTLGVRIDALVHPAETGPRVESLGPEQALVIAPGQRQFGVRMSSTELARPSRLRYQVRLAGLESEWREIGSAPEIFFNRLPPGSYRLEARVTDGTGRTPAGIARDLVVRPTVWQTVWFRTLIVAGIGLLLVALSAGWQRRRHRARLQVLEQRRALAEERTRISRDMHDEVGSGLTEIVVLSESVDEDRPLSWANPLAAIGMRSRELLDAIGSIIWALNPDNDRLDRLVAFLRESGARQAESFGLDSRFDLPPRIPGTAIGAGVVRHVTLIVREAVSNACKHANARTLTITARINADQLQMIVEDDGTGFDPEVSAGMGNGLENMHARARAVNGALEVVSRPGQGTRVCICIPLR